MAILLVGLLIALSPCIAVYLIGDTLIEVIKLLKGIPKEKKSTFSIPSVKKMMSSEQFMKQYEKTS
jgi:hypothetical protein